jgi:hypothetical protein
MEANNMNKMATHEHSVYLNEMMASLGIDLDAEALPRLNLRYSTAFHHCEACPSKEACRQWLDRASGWASFAPRFCGNADILFELQCDQPGARRVKC